jgi:hypothetical protein
VNARTHTKIAKNAKLRTFCLCVLCVLSVTFFTGCSLFSPNRVQNQKAAAIVTKAEVKADKAAQALDRATDGAQEQARENNSGIVESLALPAHDTNQVYYRNCSVAYDLARANEGLLGTPQVSLPVSDWLLSMNSSNLQARARAEIALQVQIGESQDARKALDAARAALQAREDALSAAKSRALTLEASNASLGASLADWIHRFWLMVYAFIALVVLAILAGVGWKIAQAVYPPLAIGSVGMQLVKGIEAGKEALTSIPGITVDLARQIRDSLNLHLESKQTPSLAEDIKQVKV